MHIVKLDIKGFGKISGLTLQFTKGMNIIYGGNETGKTTIQWFIRGMLFGLKGRKTSEDMFLPPLKKYRPWNGNAYGGSLEYRLDDGSGYRVDRDFDRNSVEIHDNLYNNISRTFDLNRDRGLLYADKHLGINDVCFDKTVFVKQMGTKLDDGGSSELLSRLINVSQTGHEDISFKRAEEALNKALITYVGTGKTSTKPMDKLNKRLEELTFEKSRLLEKRNEYMEVNSHLQEAVLDKDHFQEKKRYLASIKELIDDRKQLAANHEKLAILSDGEEKLNEVESQLAGLTDDIKPESESNLSNKTRRLDIPIWILLTLVTLAAGIFFNPIGYLLSIIIFLSGGAFTVYSIRVRRKVEKVLADESQQKIRREYELKMQKMQRLNDMLKDITNKTSVACGRQIENVKDIQKAAGDINEEQNSLDLKLNEGLQRLNLWEGLVKSDFFKPSEVGEVIFEASPLWLSDSWEYESEKLESDINEASLKVKELETILAGYPDSGEVIQNVDEEIAALELEKNELRILGASLELALEELSAASSEIQKNYAPLLNLRMSDIISGITGKRYNDLRADDSLSLKVSEPGNGNIREVNALSGGTIDQMYLALRLAMAELICETDEFQNPGGENLPLILDEVFSQYDDDRTALAFEYFSNNYQNRQIILFTCKSRELEIAKSICRDQVNIIEI